MFTTEQLTGRWEDQRAIKNLMGKYANCVLLNREGEIFERFWSRADDVYLGFNDGYYEGPSAVAGYYAACRARNALVARLMQAKFPEHLGGKSDEEIYGAGPFKIRPMACPIIELAGDGASAKGLWHCQGAYNDVEACGPLAHWTWGYFAVDFVREDGAWRILHLLYAGDVDCICGQSWGKPAEPLPDDPAFAPLRDFAYPPYTARLTLREMYSPARPLTQAPRIPEPYRTLSETFSYAQKEAAR